MSSRQRLQGFERILCPVDFSAHARAALRHALALARRSDARLTVLFVTDPLLATAAAAAAYDVARLSTETDAELRQFVARTAGAGGIPTEALVRLGHPATEINKTATRLNVDLIVIGTHGLSGTPKMVFGSTTEQVIRGADVPVLAIPPARPGRRFGHPASPASWPGKLVLVPTDLADDAVANAQAASEVALDFGARVIFVHVVPPAPLPGWLKARTGAENKDRREAAERRLRELTATIGRGAQSRVLAGSPVEQIARLAVRLRAGLIVIPLKRRKSLFAPRYGSISYRLLCAGAAPVVAVPGEGRRRTRRPER